MSRFISDHEDTTTTDGKTITVKYTEPKYEIRKVVYVAQESINEIADAVAKRLPTVEPKKGKWLETEFLKLRECSYCHVRWGMYDVENFDFCPNCGADMRGCK